MRRSAITWLYEMLRKRRHQYTLPLLTNGFQIVFKAIQLWRKAFGHPFIMICWRSSSQETGNSLPVLHTFGVLQISPQPPSPASREQHSLPHLPNISFHGCPDKRLYQKLYVQEIILGLTCALHAIIPFTIRWKPKKQLSVCLPLAATSYNEKVLFPTRQRSSP